MARIPQPPRHVYDDCITTSLHQNRNLMIYMDNGKLAGKAGIFPKSNASTKSPYLVAR